MGKAVNLWSPLSVESRNYTSKMRAAKPPIKAVVSERLRRESPPKQSTGSFNHSHSPSHSWAYLQSNRKSYKGEMLHVVYASARGHETTRSKMDEKTARQKSWPYPRGSINFSERNVCSETAPSRQNDRQSEPISGLAEVLTLSTVMPTMASARRDQITDNGSSIHSEHQTPNTLTILTTCVEHSGANLLSVWVLREIEMQSVILGCLACFCQHPKANRKSARRWFHCSPTISTSGASKSAQAAKYLRLGIVILQDSSLRLFRKAAY